MALHHNDASHQTKDHRRLHQTDSSMRKLMPMPRKVQRSLWRLNVRCPTYSQVTTGQPLRCRWCDETTTVSRNTDLESTFIFIIHNVLLGDTILYFMNFGDPLSIIIISKILCIIYLIHAKL